MDFGKWKQISMQFLICSSTSPSFRSLCPWQVPTVIPVIMLLASLYLVLAPIIDHPQIEFLYIFLFLLSGIPVYFLLVHFQCQPKWLQMATMYLQLLLEVAPAIKNVD